jgi:hypoxanthine phosphoribosyltransferase
MPVKDNMHWEIVQSKRKRILKEPWEKIPVVLDHFVRRLAIGTPFAWPDCKGIYAVPRGGLVLGVALSNRLHMPLLAAPTDNCVIVEDIIDSGTQMEAMYNQYIKINKAMLLVWYINPMCKKYLNRKNVACYDKVSKDTWVSFPWES